MKEAPGFRFYPTEEELISFYLQHKLEARTEPDIDCVIPVVNIYDFNPWDLPQMSGEGCRRDSQSQEWFFFIPKQERVVRGGRPNRLTTTGYWKATGSPTYVYSSSSSSSSNNNNNNNDDNNKNKNNNKIIGVKRTMVFYRGRARTRSGNSKTQWKMNEYLAIDHHHHHHQLSSSSTNPPPSQQKGEYTICRVYIKSKCLRAFDRRPGAPIIRNNINIRAHHQLIDHQTSSNHQAQTTVEIIRCSSSESSSSSGDHHLQLNNNNNNNNTNYDNNNNNNNDSYDQGTNNNTNNEQQERFLGMEIDQYEPLWEWDSLMMSWNL